MVKDIALTLSGNWQPLRVFATDEILNNSFANFAFENFEAASHASLIALADAGDFTTAKPRPRTSLTEEQAMAASIGSHNAALTLKYVERRAAGVTASH